MAKLTITKLATGCDTEVSAISTAKYLVLQEAVDRGIAYDGLDGAVKVLNTGRNVNKGWTAKVRLIVEG